MRVPDFLLKTIGYVVEVIPTMAGDDSVNEREGTAFLVGIPSATVSYYYHEYFVTAKHVIERLKGRKVSILINKTDGGNDMVRFGTGRWLTHPTDDSVDVAVTPYIRGGDEDILGIPVKMFISREQMKAVDIGVGDDVFMVGLFDRAAGEARNMPLVRHGNIAMLPEEPIQVESQFRDVYLIEARSIGGISGSPVLVRRTVSIEAATEHGPVSLHGTSGELHLLGLAHGHWDIRESEMNEPSFIQDRARGVNLGIGIVVPAAKILEVLDHPELKEARKVGDERWRVASGQSTI